MISEKFFCSYDHYYEYEKGEQDLSELCFDCLKVCINDKDNKDYMKFSIISKFKRKLIEQRAQALLCHQDLNLTQNKLNQIQHQIQRMFDITKETLIKQIKETDRIYRDINDIIQSVDSSYLCEFDLTKAIQYLTYGLENLNPSKNYQEQLRTSQNYIDELSKLQMDVKLRLNDHFKKRVYCGIQYESYYQTNYVFEDISHESDVLCGQISPDNKMIISCSVNKLIILWDPLNQIEIQRIDVPQAIYAVRFSTYKKIIFLGNSIGYINIMNLNNSFKVKSILKIHTSSINDIAEIEDHVIITHSQDQTIKKTNLYTKECLFTIPHQSYGPQNIDYSQKHNILLGSIEQFIFLWDVQNGKEITKFDSTFEICVSQVYFSNNQDKVVAISEMSKLVKIYQIEKSQQQLLLKQIQSIEVIYSPFNVQWGKEDQSLVVLTMRQFIFIELSNPEKQIYLNTLADSQILVKQNQSLDYLIYIIGSSLVVAIKMYDP